ncbi:Protein-tyrosine sulfotransferase [Eumeta japonica]|uniref:Protein-tyrosine sulfotransferase n=1 Tax=Eumeta variegata TaxID=151549 RepID=A0A4C1XJJ6_EUMVA|nr:Protein-tyrosine sulfotransferase [Eumeta japonica]
MGVRARWRAAAALAVGGVLLLLWSWRCGRTADGAGAVGAQLTRELGAPVEGRELPLIFVGGVPRSGTTLMRAMLDAHPMVRCGQETRVVPRILQMRQHWIKSQKESVRLEQAGISKAVLDNAIAAFCLEVIVRHGEPAPRLCNKDPLMLKMGTYVLELFPNAKFLFMVRDGRATVHSIISRQVTITGFDLTSYRQCLIKWNHAVELMFQQCKAMGPEKCLMVHYERLVLQPREQLQRVLRFLDLPWDEAVLHHEQYIDRPNGVALSKRLSEIEAQDMNRCVCLSLTLSLLGGLTVLEWKGRVPFTFMSVSLALRRANHARVEGTRASHSLSL